MKNKMNLLLNAAALVLSLSAHAQEDPFVSAGPEAMGADFSAIPPARTVEESKARLEARRRAVLEQNAVRPQGPYGRDVGSFHGPALSKLATNTDVAAVDAAITDPAAKVYAKPGTEFSLGPICRRNGDYDFMLIGLVRLASLYGDDPRLSIEARDKILYELLSERGTDHHVSICLDVCGCRADTENHVLMTETSRYLTNDLLRLSGIQGDVFDNALNGFDGWMTHHLQRFLKHGFGEYNSRPYQIYSVHALENLYDFAGSATVKRAAQMTLDYLSARFAIHSNNLRRSVPFRRQVAYAEDTNLFSGNGEAARYAVLAGNYQAWATMDPPFQPPYGAGHMIGPALTSYRIPDPILDLMIRKDRGAYFQKFRLPYDGAELVYSSPSFMISAGGRFIPMFDLGTGENDGRALATVLMPTHGGADSAEYIRIAGHKKESKRQNTCVAPGFACGLNPVVPSSIPEACIERTGNWTFVNTASAACPLRHRYYAAVFSKPCDTKDCRKAGPKDAASFGFFEAVEFSKMSYETFKSHVLEKNTRPFASGGENLYLTASGLRIHFVPQPKKGLWEIVRINGAPLERDFTRWPVAEGDVMRADGEGLVVFRNPFLKECLVLDHRDPLKPQRYAQQCETL